PASLARAMGADIVIAVDLNSDILHRHMHPLAVVREPQASVPTDAAPVPGPEPVPEPLVSTDWMRRLKFWAPASGQAPPPKPSALDVIMTGVNIMQMRITRSRMAGDPPEVVIAPRLAHLGLLDFHRASEAIAEGRRAAHASLPQLRQFMG